MKKINRLDNIEETNGFLGICKVLSLNHQEVENANRYIPSKGIKSDF